MTSRKRKRATLTRSSVRQRPKLGEFGTAFTTPIKSLQLFSEARGSVGHGPGSQSSQQSVTISSSDQLIEALRKALSSPRPAEETSSGSKIKEADTIKIPAFPAPETYRDCHIKVRDPIVAASTNREGRTIDELKSPGSFGALDAKLMSALTSTLVGDFARRINTLKGTEAAKSQQVWCRQPAMHDQRAGRQPCKWAPSSSDVGCRKQPG